MSQEHDPNLQQTPKIAVPHHQDLHGYTPRFTNLYWSIDYITGFNSLKSQSFKSIKQLHEIRKLVFNYMSYFNANSQFLNKSSIDLFPIESVFLPFNSDKDRTSSTPPSRNITPLTSAYKKKVDSTKDQEQEREINMCTAYGKYIDQMSQESTLLLNLTSIIDRDVLEGITQFLKFNEPEINKQFGRLDLIYNEYLKSYKTIDKLKSKHAEQLRSKEFAQSSGKLETTLSPSTKEEETSTSFEESYADEESYTDEEEEEGDENDATKTLELDFPLELGTVVVSGSEDLQNILNLLINKVPTIPRKIPLPGYKNQIFSSDSLTSILTRFPIRGLKPSRANLEKFGQSLLDLKFITSNNFFNNKRFKSEGLWFEWSDLAIHYSEFKKNSLLESSSVKDTNSVGTSGTTSTTTNKTSSTIASPKTNKFMSDMAETTTRFNAMFNNVKSSIMKTNYNEVLGDLEVKYTEEIITLQEKKYLLENGLFEISKFLESFERSKVELIYKSLSRLLEILVKYQKLQYDKAQMFSNDFTHKINKSSNYDRDFNKTLENFSTGIYFSSLILSDVASNHNQGVSLTSTFQNLKYQFDLYKDIPLQLQNNFNSDNESLLSIASIPYILYQTIKIIEERSNESIEDIKNLWSSPINYQDQWKLKQDLTEIISEFIPDLKNDLANKNLIEQEFINRVLNHLKSLKTSSVIVFIKSWLLDISDSIIPFVVFDSLMNLYNEDRDVASEDVIKILSTIPRSNLSSLIYILEYVGNLFELGKIPSYEISDELPDESLITTVDIGQIQDVSEQLNSMEEIGSLPIVHLILRPSSSKHSSGFKPPLNKYKRLFADLLKLKVRTQLLKHLVDNETKYKSKKEAEKLHVKRVSIAPSSPEPPKTPAKLNIPTNKLSTPRPDSGEFTLRPFRTKVTPLPSPQTSPKRESTEPGTNSLSPTGGLLVPQSSSNEKGHNRALSNTNFMVPKIAIEFEQ